MRRTAHASGAPPRRPRPPASDFPTETDLWRHGRDELDAVAHLFNTRLRRTLLGRKRRKHSTNFSAVSNEPVSRRPLDDSERSHFSAHPQPGPPRLASGDALAPQPPEHHLRGHRKQFAPLVARMFHVKHVGAPGHPLPAAGRQRGTVGIKKRGTLTWHRPKLPSTSSTFPTLAPPPIRRSSNLRLVSEGPPTPLRYRQRGRSLARTSYPKLRTPLRRPHPR